VSQLKFYYTLNTKRDFFSTFENLFLEAFISIKEASDTLEKLILNQGVEMKLLIICLFVSSIAWAQTTQVNVQNFNFNYQAPFGDGTADTFSYQSGINTPQSIHIEKIGEDFKIILEGVENQEYTLKDAPELIRNAEKMKLQNVNFSFSEKLSLGMASAVFNSPEQNVEIKGMALNCEVIKTQQEVMDQALLGCIQKMTLKSSGISTDGATSIANTFMSAVDDRHNVLKASVGVKNLSMKITNGKFDLSADVKAQISGTAKASGSFKYDQSSKKLTVKISEIKLGVLNVTSQVFTELKKQESSTLKVNEPYVYITLK